MSSWIHKITRLDMTIWTIGFTTIVTQIVFMRECLTVFYGNEIAIGSLLCAWLIWTGIGSLWGSKQRGKRFAILFLQISLAICLPLTYLGIRASRMIFGVTPGEIIGLGPMFLLVLGLLAPFCLLSGAFYPAACHRLTDRSGASGSADRPYIIEAAGSGIGGLIASLILLPKLATSAILLDLCALNLLVAAFMYWADKRKSRFGLVSGLVFLALLSLLPKTEKALDHLIDRAFLNGQSLLFSGNTAYGHVAFTRRENQLTLYYNGLYTWSAPDLLTAEEAVHFALIQTPSPKRILLLGAGPEGALQQALKYPSITAVYYTDPDGQLRKLIEDNLPTELSIMLNDSRIHILTEDGRAFLSRKQEPFDAIVVNMPSPYTAQINRYYTQEFFSLARRNLTPNGIFSLSLQGSENLIGRELSDFLSDIYGTLESVFPHCIALPGETVRLIAAENGSYLSTDADTLAKRIYQRKLDTQYVQGYYLFDRLSAERENYLKERLHSVPTNQLNRDFRPIGFYFDAILWATYFSKTTKSIYQTLHPFRTIHILGLTIGILGILSLIAWKRKPEKWCAPGVDLSILSVGFTEISLEYTLLLGFQIICGHLYPQVALLLAAYMTGLGLGAWHQHQKSDVHSGMAHFIRIQMLMAVLPLLVLVATTLVHKIGEQLEIGWITTGLSILLAASGFIGGKQFILANQLLVNRNRSVEAVAGRLYGLDLIGSSFGALTTSALLIPLLGLYDVLWILIVLNAMTALFLYCTNRPEHPS